MRSRHRARRASPSLRWPRSCPPPTSTAASCRPSPRTAKATRPARARCSRRSSPSSPITPTSLEVYGMLLGDAGELDRAIEVTTRVLATRPDSIMAHANISRFWMLKGDKGRRRGVAGQGARARGGRTRSSARARPRRPRASSARPTPSWSRSRKTPSPRTAGRPRAARAGRQLPQAGHGGQGRRATQAGALARHADVDRLPRAGQGARGGRHPGRGGRDLPSRHPGGRRARRPDARNQMQTRLAALDRKAKASGG